MPSLVLSDIVIPEVFSRYTRFLSTDLSTLVQSGALTVDPVLVAALIRGGNTMNYPFWDALAQSNSRIGSDDPASVATPQTAGTTGNQIIPRLSRNNSWGQMHLALTGSGENALGNIQGQLAHYWAIELQKIIIAMVSGINKDNGANDSADMSVDITGSGFTNATSFSSSALVDAGQTLGDHQFTLTILLAHSVVASRMQKLEYLTSGFRPSEQPSLARWGRYLVLITDMMPSGTNAVLGNGNAGVTGVYETWMCAPGCFRVGLGAPLFSPSEEIERLPATGNGAGQTVLHQRVEYGVGVPGFSYTATYPEGGPSNAATANNLNHAGSWDRTVNDRKQVRFARLVTREHG